MNQGQLLLSIVSLIILTIKVFEVNNRTFQTGSGRHRSNSGIYSTIIVNIIKYLKTELVAEPYELLSELSSIKSNFNQSKDRELITNLRDI